MNIKNKAICCLLLILALNAYSQQGLVTVKIVDAYKAAQFNKKYNLVIPVQDYKQALSGMFEELFKLPIKNQVDTSFIYLTDVYFKNSVPLKVPHEPRQIAGPSILNDLWMSPLWYDSTGFLYMSNEKIINYKYKSGILKTYTIGNQLDKNIDFHNVVNQGDTIYYYSATHIKDKKIAGRDTMITDFDFYEWNEKTNKTRMLFSASEIVPDSLLVPELFEANENNGLYSELDIYHWNWMEKTGPNKLLVNFAFCGFMQIDIVTKSIDWYWGYKGSSFKKITGVGDLTNPYYTHCVNKIKSGPYAGCYSYFENGGGSPSDVDSVIIQKPTRSRIFSIDTVKNTLHVENEIIFDPTKTDSLTEAHSAALGSVHVLDNYILVNLGMVFPFEGLMKINKLYGKNAILEYWEAHTLSKVYLYDLKGKEIARYTFPYGIYSYSAWIHKLK